MSDDEEEVCHRRRDALKMSIVGTKGLLNPCGENNCFLNSAVQVWKYRVAVMYINFLKCGWNDSSRRLVNIDNISCAFHYRNFV